MGPWGPRGPMGPPWGESPENLEPHGPHGPQWAPWAPMGPNGPHGPHGPHGPYGPRDPPDPPPSWSPQGGQQGGCDPPYEDLDNPLSHADKSAAFMIRIIFMIEIGLRPRCRRPGPILGRFWPVFGPFFRPFLGFMWSQMVPGAPPTNIKKIIF